MVTDDNLGGWHGEPDGRGTFTILKTCLGTIILLCWSSVCPNVPKLRSNQISQLEPRLHLFLLALLGPDFVLMVALGQYNAACESRKKFLDNNFTSWTLRQCFYVNMGGIHLKFDDHESFPVDCQQLYLLHERGYLTLPEINDDEIEDRNKSDGLSRFIAIVQSLWFTIDAFGRISQGLHISTLELTTLAFVFIMTCCSIFWWRKPMGISRPQVIKVEQHRLSVIQRAFEAPSPLYGRTPLSFLNRDEWFLTQFWTSYISILRVLRLVPRKSKRDSKEDHFPSIQFLRIGVFWEFVSLLLVLGYSGIFLAAWSFTFPTLIEKTLWRISGIITIGYVSLGSALYWHWKNASKFHAWLFNDHADVESELIGPRASEKKKHFRAIRDSMKKIGRHFDWMRNMDPDQDPALRTSALVWFLASLLSATYVLSRGYVLVEDIIGLRSLPPSAYDTVNWGQFSPIL